ncbi:hypothetical protein [Nitriliruptor alkaliphilus]|uniref:hypothetical protein n=1 Tax=Nitriliruptor alkaliphilus TaxID=427918 RepID=UPI000696499B|nr:hypothetical protein [Nitriliruptor alkaliphilus]
MTIAALIAWVVTALGGFALFGMWLTRRREADAAPSRIGPGLIFAHLLLAATGLVIWLVHVLGLDEPWIRWLALAILVVVTGLGLAMSARWAADRKDRSPPPTPEQGFPVVLVAGHGVLAVVTLVLVALIAFGVA